MSHFGDMVRQARQRAGIGQRELAIRARTSQSAISRIENGREEPSFERFGRLMRAMGWKPRLELVPIAEHDLSPAEMHRQAGMTPQERFDEFVVSAREARPASNAEDRSH